MFNELASAKIRSGSHHHAIGVNVCADDEVACGLIAGDCNTDISSGTVQQAETEIY